MQHPKLAMVGGILACGACATTPGDSVAAAAPAGHYFHPEHFRWIVDSETAEALASSPLESLLGNFQTSERQLPNGDRYRGFYLYGDTTFLELTVEIAVAGLDVFIGDCSIGFDAEARGSVYWLAETMVTRHPESNPARARRDRNRGEESVPWYESVRFEPPSGMLGFDVWAKELDADFKRTMDPRLPAEERFTRKRPPHLSSFPGQLFRDVIGAKAAVSEERRRQLADLMRVMGYEIEEGTDATVCRGSDFTLELFPPTDGVYSLVEVRLALNGVKEGQRVFPLGRSTLYFERGPFAVWRFR